MPRVEFKVNNSRSFIRVQEGDTSHSFAIHRLTYVAEYGLDKLRDAGQIHHIGCRWNNNPENLIDRRAKPLPMLLSTKGYEYFRSEWGGEASIVQHHRLLYVAEHGLEALDTDERIRHKNGIFWDNRPSNIITERSKPPTLRVDQNGYEYFCCSVGEKDEKVPHHRLLYVAEHGFDALDADDLVHHENHIRWDNRPGNLSAESREDHAEYHFTHYHYSNFEDTRHLPDRDDSERVEEHIRTEYQASDTVSVPTVAGKMGIAPTTAREILSLLAETPLLDDTDDGYRVTDPATGSSASKPHP